MKTVFAKRIDLVSDFSLPKVALSVCCYDNSTELVYVCGGITGSNVFSKLILKIDLKNKTVENFISLSRGFLEGKSIFADMEGKKCMILCCGYLENLGGNQTGIDFYAINIHEKSYEHITGGSFNNKEFMEVVKVNNSVIIRVALEYVNFPNIGRYLTLVGIREVEKDGELWDQSSVFKLDIFRRKVISSSLSPTFPKEHLELPVVGCIVGNYYYGWFIHKKLELGSEPLMLYRFNLVNVKEWEFVSKRKIVEIKNSLLLQFKETYLIHINGDDGRARDKYFSDINPFGSRLLQILDLRTLKWKEVLVEGSGNFFPSRFGVSVFLRPSGDLYFYGGILMDKNELQITSNFYSVSLFQENDQDDQDVKERTQFVLETEYGENFEVRILKSLFVFACKKFLFWE